MGDDDFATINSLVHRALIAGSPIVDMFDYPIIDISEPDRLPPAWRSRTHRTILIGIARQLCVIPLSFHGVNSAAARVILKNSPRLSGGTLSRSSSPNTGKPL